ncbi:MAG: AAA family ATPase, partial [Alphaproteobacteria bacterium]|nr:AAA family ATPase [Alphaproteobacteria bacterium]
RAAHQQAPKAITKGRSFSEIAMDDMINAFEHVMRDLPDEDVPMDYYRQMMVYRRDGRDVSMEEAQKQFVTNMGPKRAAREVRLGMPDFIALGLDKNSAQITNALAQNWANTLNHMQALLQTESALRAQTGARQLSEAFNMLMRKHNTERAHQEKMLQELEELDTGGKKANAAGPAATPAPAPSVPAKVEDKIPPALTKLLEAFGEDLTKAAAAKKLSAVIGRDEDVERTMAALVRTTRPHALLTGNEGIGKSAVTNGLAQRITEGNVPAELKDAMVVRLKLREMKASSGMTQGAHPKMGEARMFDQFGDWLSKIVNETAAYNAKGGRQIILNIDELGEMGGRIPTMIQAKDILIPAMAEHKSLRIIGEITEVKRATVDESSPGLLASFTDIKLKPLTKEQVIESVRQNGFPDLPTELIAKAMDWTSKFISEGEQPGKTLNVLVSAQSRAKILGKDQPGENELVDILSDMTKRPKHMFGKSRSEQMIELERELPNRVLGQPVIKDILRVIKAGNSSMQDPNKPIASILSVGPTGNGKTETAKAIAELLGIPLVTIDMSNFQDQHAKAKLLGAPPGYVGFDKKAALEEVAENPYCVLLLDEIDKAHPEAHNIFLSVLDEGRQQLMNGKTVRFNNCIIMMTSNFGARAAQEAKDSEEIGFHAQKGGENAAKLEYKKAIDSKMPPEYQNRLDHIAYYDSLSQDVMKKIAVQKIEKVSKALRDAENIDLKMAPEAIEELSAKGVGYSPEYGARPLDRAIKNLVKVPLIEWMEEHHKDKTKLITLFIKSVKEGAFKAEIIPPPAQKSLGAPAPG